jgi:phosphoenolpyruvate carboxykinase (GTP)
MAKICDGKVHAKETPIGRVPEVSHLDTSGLDMSAADVMQLLSVDIEGWLRELPSIREHFAHLGNHLPKD